MKYISHGKYEHSKTEISAEVQNLLSEFRSFKLGEFLADNLGLNGYWTSYILNHPDQGRITGINESGQNFSKIEKWLLDSCPIFIATQERFRIFKRINNSRLSDNFRAASVPCGLMDDLLQLDYQNFENITLQGVDLDPNSIELAKANSSLYKSNNIINFVQSDAWQWSAKEQFNLITSNGLNIYVNEEEKCKDLYQNFYDNLTKGGALVISFITPEEQWRPQNPSDLLYQKYIFKDVIPVKWQCLRSEEQTRKQLESCGFKIKQIEYDSQKMFPTVLALKD